MGASMLFLLTGDVQIGKTRWLEKLCGDLAAAGVCVAGVIAPGQWVPRAEEQPGGRHGFDGEGRFEKLGIDNVLLPQGERIVFARRRDLAEGDQPFAQGEQAKAAQLAWAISDEAIAQVNNHFTMLAAMGQRDCPFVPLPGGDANGRATTGGASADGDSAGGHPTAGGALTGAVSASEKLAPAIATGSFLVVDELGRLELLRGCGLTNAVALLDAGPTPTFPHALAVVRETLLDQAINRFAPAWGKPHPIAPGDEARQLILNTFGVR